MALPAALSSSSIRAKRRAKRLLWESRAFSGERPRCRARLESAARESPSSEASLSRFPSKSPLAISKSSSDNSSSSFFRTEAAESQSKPALEALAPRRQFRARAGSARGTESRRPHPRGFSLLLMACHFRSTSSES